MITKDYNTNLEILQDVRNKKSRPWRPKKVKNLMLADSYHRLDQHKRANRIWWCACDLVFQKNIETGEKTLYSANFCKERLCPMCQWRRTYKVFYEVSRVLDLTHERYEDLVPIFLTLTIKNCTAAQLSRTIDDIFLGWKNVTNHRKIKRIVMGWFRALEVTYDGDEIVTEERYKRRKEEYDRIGIKPGDENANYDTFHPHIHVILLVNKVYFKKDSKDYMYTRDWVKIWRTAMKLNYDPICDIRGVKNRKGKRKAVAEVAKYTLKDSEFLTNDKDLTDRLVDVLSKSLRYRRLYGFGGVLKEIARELKVEKPDKGDLVHIDEESIREDIATVLEVYKWNFGLANYVKFDVGGKKAKP